ncbi:MAG: cell division protein FtsQ/DivIB [Solirubrobacterales bacterium]|nr:cell division protein FtsQ/DivIB [Solirubrobacterales bacterium]
MSARVSTRGRGAAKKRTPVSRTAELAQRRERRSFRIRLVAFTSLMLLLLLAAGYMFWLRDSSLVGIKNLKVEGISVHTEEGKQIDQAVRTAMGEMTTLDVKPEILDQELARFPRVADAEIETKFPDSATVTVTTRENGSVYGDGSDAVLVATDGTVLGPANGQEDSLPRIEGVPKDVPAGQVADAGDLVPPGLLNQALVLGATPPELRTYVEGTRLSSDGVRLVLTNGLILLFGDASHVDEKWRAAAALIADPSFTDAGYVDLTVPRRPAVSEEAPPASAPDEAPEDASTATAAE